MLCFSATSHAGWFAQMKKKFSKGPVCSEIFIEEYNHARNFIQENPKKPSDAELYAPPLPLNIELPKTRNEWLRKPYLLTSKIMSFVKGEQYGYALHKDFYGRKVIYLDEEERKNYQVFIQNGLLVNRWGKRICIEKCRGIFVMSLYGDIYFSDKPVYTQFHHTSFLAGEDVAAAGELKIKNGKIRSVNNLSGHYRPTYAHVFQFLLELQAQGVQSNYKIEFYDMTGNYMYDYRTEKIHQPLRKASLKKIAKDPTWAFNHIGPVPWELLVSDDIIDEDLTDEGLTDDGVSDNGLSSETIEESHLISE